MLVGLLSSPLSNLISFFFALQTASDRWAQCTRTGRPNPAVPSHGICGGLDSRSPRTQQGRARAVSTPGKGEEGALLVEFCLLFPALAGDLCRSRSRRKRNAGLAEISHGQDVAMVTAADGLRGNYHCSGESL